MAIRGPVTLARVLGVALLVLGLLAQPRTGEARLDPFYIIHGQSYGDVVPRVLFVVDTSGSMSFEQPWPDVKCSWSGCESDGPGQSRITAARRVINEVVAQTGDSATFGLMTFGMAEPPKSSEEVPEKCYSWDWGGWVRFTWVAYANQPYSNVWKPLTNAFGGQGSWVLCGDNRPFPYLRHDDLGGFELPNHSQEPLLDDPLVTWKADYGAFKSGSNYTRKVQFFPRFIGRRANLDCSDERQKAIVTGSHGDWGSSKSQKLNSICGRDFYYWPYVDGNPGYSYYYGYSMNSMWHVECEDDGDCYSTTSQAHRLGTNRRYYDDGATLFVPFYSAAVLAAADVPDDAKGPLSPDDAEVMFDGLTSKAHLGGLDVSGGTPWRVAIGNIDWFVTTDGDGKLIPKPATPKSNAAFSHTTVASYLAFLTTVADEDLCRPTVAILVSDGQPDPWESQGGTELYTRLAKLRKRLGVKVYLVGFSEGSWNNPTAWARMHHMACAAAGANNTSAPCAGTNDYGWDTCANPDDPEDGCAWLASDDAELAEALGTIIDDIIETSIPAGPPMVTNEFQLSEVDDPESDQAAVQTTLDAWTQTPGWFGHVARSPCTHEDPDNPGELAPYCQNAIELELETEELESFGPCPLGRVWDAGECLAQTFWKDRRLYTHGFDNEIIRIAEDGQPTPAFEQLVLALDEQGELDPPLTPGAEGQEIAAMVRRLAGEDTPQGWKLPGIANSAPILVRRVPRYDGNFLPSVGIRDPHCAGRRNVVGDSVPDSLEAFAKDAWATTSGEGLAAHYDYAEAVLIGDDFGLVHAFHYDSGNELFGFLPLALINNARVLAANGTANFGQVDALAEHVYGIASTINAGWAFDHEAQVWRHLAVFGFGPGGSEIMTIDVAHMGRVQDDPVEVVWTTTTSALADDYAATLGETWSRPALTYATPNHEMSLEPRSYLVFGSGYRNGVGDPRRGRVVWVVDAITGETVTDRALMAEPEPGTTYDLGQDFAALGDVAVGSHCLSRYWGEMQEAYWTDPAGRLYRWDLATEVGDVEQFPHVADSGGTWAEDGEGFAQAIPAFRFPACQGEDEFSCTIAAIAPNGNKGDVFTFAPAVVANRRIDDIDAPGDILPDTERDQFLIALVSGSPNDTAIDGGAEGSDYHASLYLLADDHREDPEGGFEIPANAPTTAPGAHPTFMRLPLSSIERTRHVVFPDGTSEDQTREFSRRARPIRAPMIRVTGAADGTEQVDAEVYYVTYTIYEPGAALCDPRWFDEDAGEWVYDAGATYEVSFRLAIGGDEPFDFGNSYSLPGDPDDGFGDAGALSGPVVSQLASCTDGNCGASLVAPRTKPCDPNEDAPPVGGAISVSLGWSEIEGFTPLELPL